MLVLPLLLVLLVGLLLVPVVELSLCSLTAGLIVALFLAPDDAGRP